MATCDRIETGSPSEDELIAARKAILTQCARWGASGPHTIFRVPKPPIVAAALQLERDGVLECTQDQDHHGLPRLVLRLTRAGEKRLKDGAPEGRQ